MKNAPGTSWPRNILIGVELFVAFTAIVSGFMLAAKNGAGMPASLLQGSPFHSYLLPGLILAIVVGGTNLIAAVLLARRNPYGLEASAVAGFGLIIWIFVQMYLLRQSHWLQVLYFGLGILILLLTVWIFRTLGRGSSG